MRAALARPTVGLPEQVQDVRGLSVVLVETPAQRVLWNTLLTAEHPRGAKWFMGPNYSTS